MPKIEIPTSVTLYIQWILHPFEKPQVQAQKSANSKWALDETKELLEANYIEADDVILSARFNGNIQLEIVDPEKKVNNGDKFWKEVLNILTKSDNIESIHVLVNNDTSEKIACIFADRVARSGHHKNQGYQGHNNVTLIYHK